MGWLAAGLLTFALGACSTAPIATSSATSAALELQLRGWQQVTLPGKRPTQYRWIDKDGAAAVHAVADRSVSMFRRSLVQMPELLGEVEFAWQVSALPTEGDVSQSDTEDAAARVLFAFAGDEQRLSPRNRMMFELARAITGESPPFATLMYVWDARAPVGTVIINPRSDRIRKIVVESGAQALGQWRHYRRNLSDDFRLAFDEAPGALQAVALMTDGDNTGSQLSTWYRDVVLR